MIPTSGNLAVIAFIEGKTKNTPNTVSTGKELFLFGNKIAEWIDGNLFISNGNYEGPRGETGSATTKVRLNDLPNVSIGQARKKWYLNGKEWNGEWIKVEGVKAPEQIQANGNVFVLGTHWVSDNAWRGYEEPIYACVGANDTGMYSDSPCPSNVRESELKAIENELSKNGIAVKQKVCHSSNVFCVHVYLVPKIKDVERAREIVKEFLANNDTRLAYVVENELTTA